MSAWKKNSSIFRRVSGAIVIVLAIVMASGLSSHVSAAQSSNQLQLRGTGESVRLQATPGTVASADITIRNEGSQSEDLKATLQKLGQDSNGTVTFAPRTPHDAYFDSATLTPDTFTLGKNQQKTVRISVTVPQSPVAGYYFAVVFSRALSPDLSGDRITGPTFVEPVLVETQVSGTKRELAVADFHSLHGISEYLPETFVVAIKNTGNVSVVPHGDVTIRQGNGALARLQLNTTNDYILPGVTRIYSVQWNDGFPRTITNKQGKPALDVNWSNAGKFRIGQYTADLTMIYDNDQRDIIAQKSLSFIIMPWTLLLVSFILLALLLWAVVMNIFRFEQSAFHRLPNGSSPPNKPLNKKAASLKKPRTGRNRKK